jgi:hypothetical protein
LPVRSRITVLISWKPWNWGFGASDWMPMRKPEGWPEEPDEDSSWAYTILSEKVLATKDSLYAPVAEDVILLT